MGISQEDIDNMVKESASGTDAPPPAEPAAGGEDDIRAKYQQDFASHLGNIIATLTGVDVKAERAGEEISKVAELGEVLKGDWVAAISSFELGGVIPTGHFLSKPAAAIIAGKILGQDPPEELGDEHLNTIKEAFSNLMGAWVTGIGEIIKMEAKLSGEPELLEGDIAAALAAAEGFADDNALVWSYSLVIDGSAGEYLLIIPEKATKEMVMAHPEFTVDSPDQAPAAEAQPEAAVDAAPPGPEVIKPEVEVEKPVFQQFEGGAEVEGPLSQMSLLFDVPLTVSVELGRKRLSIREILDMVPGSLLELEKLAGEPVDLMVNGKLFAHGEVVIIDENFGVRVSSIVSPKERLERLK